MDRAHMFLGDRLGICFFGTRGVGSWGRSSGRGSGPADRVARVPQSRPLHPSCAEVQRPILRITIKSVQGDALRSGSLFLNSEFYPSLGRA
jgi:hypothetical protein